jgi:predicted lipoprotein
MIWNKKIFAFGLFTILIVFLTNCESGTISESEYLTSFNRSEQLVKLYDNRIIPLHDELYQEAIVLEEKTNLFISTKNEIHLNSLREQWKKTTEVWKQCELFDIAAISSSFIHFRIHRWPTDTDKILQLIDGTEIINTISIEGKGSSVKGFAAMEYLLFSNETIDFVNSERKTQYLLSLSTNLKNNISELKELWLSSENDFKTATENGISGSQNLLMNAIINSIEETVLVRIGKAINDNNSEVLEAHYSEYSLVLIQNTLSSIKQCFTAEYNTNHRKTGFVFYLKELNNEQLATNIVDQIEICETQLATFPNSFKSDIENNNSTEIKKLLESFNDLLYLIKIDMANSIGSTITFSDNDGD